MEELDIYKLISLIENELREIPKGTLKPDSDMTRAIEWSSLNVLMLLSLIQVEFNVNIGADRLSKCRTIEELYARIVEMKTT